MNKLLINTATDELFIVLKKGNEIFSRVINSKMHHNETMLPVIDEILKENGVSVNDIDEFGVVVGPGSFTGIRVGISTIKAFRDVVKVKAKGINNLNYLYKLAKNVNDSIETVAIAGSKDSYFVAKLINGIVYIYDRNLTLEELKTVSENKPVGMFAKDENINSIVVEQNAEIFLSCLEKSTDETLVPVYYQLSQAENEKLKRIDLKLEVASIEDLNEISKLEKDNILTNTMSCEQIRDCLNSENYIVLKAVVENEIVGFIILQKTDELNIDSIAVKKEFRNLGIATKLIEKAECFAKENNINVISLEVSYTNVRAYLLYQKLGFATRRIRKNYYSDGSDCVEMIKDI